MRSTSDADEEATILTTESGIRLLEEVGSVVAPGPAELMRWRKRTTPELVAAALRLVESRRRGAAKFARADRMWLKTQGVEQATAEVVARHKARRFEAGWVVDLVAGIGGDSLALAERSRVLAVDRDRGMCRRILWNAEVYDVGHRVHPIQATAERAAIPPGALVHVDPDRRARAGPRARHLGDYVPGLDFLRSLPESARGGAIKLGPASDFASHFDAANFEAELISFQGECKEATVWFGSLATCRRRATRLPEGATWTDRDGPPAPWLPTLPPSAWVFDPDPALLRSGLLASFAVTHGLSRGGSGVDYLTGPERVESPFLAAFKVLEVFPLDLKLLRRVVAERGLGPLEIKMRGLDLRPESVRGRLRPPGPNPSTLILIGGDGPARVLLARRA